MNYSEIKYCDIANGPGVRTSLFVSGCRHHCPECFNEVAWPFDSGEPFDEGVGFQVLTSLQADYVAGLTILGGEPLEPENQAVLADFLGEVHSEFPEKGIWLFTGFTWEELMGGQARCCTSELPRILDVLHVLVDGRFERELKDVTLRFRGSSNQRPIDVPRTLIAGEPVLWEDEQVYSTHLM